MRFLTIVYWRHDLILWDLDEENVFDIYEKDMGSRLNDAELNKPADGSPSVWAVAFSAAVGTSLVAATYHDGDLISYDSETGLVTGYASPSAQSICSSPDGRTLATGDASGNIPLLDFQTLKLLTRIQFQGEHENITSLAFTSDSLKLIEARGNQCRIWQPTVLLREDGEEDTSDALSISTAPLEIEVQEDEPSNDITAIFCSQSASRVFCGKEDGAVWVYDISHEPEGTYLFTPSEGSPVTSLWFEDERGSLLVCRDVSSGVTCRWIRRRPDHGWDVSGSTTIDAHTGERIEQMLASEEYSRLISTEGKTTLWSINKDTQDRTSLARLEAVGGQRWMSDAGSGVSHSASGGRGPDLQLG